MRPLIAERSSSRRSVGLINGSATDHGAEHADFGVLRWRDFSQVVWENDEVGVFAHLQFALLPFLELRISGTRSVSPDAIFQRNFFLRLPAFPGPAFRTLARHTSIQAAKRADRLDVVVRPKGEADAILQHGVPRVRALDALTAHAILGPAHVRGLVRRLHRSNHFEFREALKVHWRNHLSVLDAVAAVAWPVSFGHCLENVQANAVGAIADGVKRQLESSLVALDGHDAQFVWIVREDARGGRIIAIGFEQRRRARA